MSARPPGSPRSSSPHDEGDGRVAQVLTSERVPLRLPVAGLGERALAWLVDAGILLLGALALLFVYNFTGDLQRDVSALSSTGALLLGIGVVGVVLSYDVVSELLAQGCTPGKRLLKLRVVRRDGLPPDVTSAVLRNCLRLVDMLPFGYAVGSVVLFATGTRRLGDLVAGTLVISERARARDNLAALHLGVHDDQTNDAIAGAALPSLDDDAALRGLAMLERAAVVDHATAEALCRRALPTHERAAPSAQARLRALVAQTRRPGSVVDSLVRLDAARVSVDDALAALTHARRKGDPAVEEVERVDAAARHGSSELLRALQRGVPARHVEALSLALLDVQRRQRDPGARRMTLMRFVGHEVPRAVWLERALIGRAAVVLVLGGVLGSALAWSDASLARALLGDDLATHVEKGADWTNRIEQDGSFAVTSVSVILNNVSVGVRVFVLGLFGAVATLLGLLTNGIQLGAVFGYAFRLGTHATLARFIAAHGPVELTMVCIAGAAGMCLGRATLAPGRRTRLSALRVEGARGLRLLTAATLGFVFIGTVEGFVSPGQMFPAVVNAAIGMLLWLTFIAWIATRGRHAASTHADDVTSGDDVVATPAHVA